MAGVRSGWSMLWDYMVGPGRQEWAYAIPLLGDIYRSSDNYYDYMQMQRDYERNRPGRTILYPSVRGFSANAYSSAGSALSGGLHLGKKAFGTYADVMDM